MALIDCPECGKRISDKAESCPNCGVPIRRRKDPENSKKNPALVVVAIIGAIVAVVVLLSAGSDFLHAFGF